MTSGDAAAAVPTAPVVHPGKVGLLPPDRLRIVPGPDGTVATDPARSGWRYLSFRTRAAGRRRDARSGRARARAVVVTISGGGVEIALDGGPGARPARPAVGLRGHALERVHARRHDAAGSSAGRCPGAGRRRDRPGAADAAGRGRDGADRRRPEDVEIEIRGAGNATRQVNNIMMPGFPADRLLVCEVFTPDGNWSGWPPHKHDVDDMPREAVLEETYYYQISRPEAWAIQRVYHRDGSRDLVLPVRSRRPRDRRPGLPPVRLHPGLRRLLPQRPGRGPADDGEQRRSGSRLGPATWPALAPDPRLPLVRP